MGSIVGIGLIFFFMGRNDSSGKSSFNALGISFPSLFPSNQATSTIVQSQGNSANIVGPASLRVNSVSERYYSLDYHFFFEKPKEFRITEIPDDNGTVILAEGNSGESFQIFIVPFDESGPLTSARIKKDLPQKIIENPQNGVLDGIPALAFSSRDALKNVFEVWFIRDKSLYQITTNANFADGLQKILQTWKFTN